MAHPSSPLKTHSRQTGSSLIEVLVSVFVLAFGLLGIASMQANALRNTQGALEQSTAVFLTNSMLEAMRATMQTDPANPGRLIVRPEYAANSSFICLDSSIPSGNALVSNDIRKWLKNIRDNLNGGAADTNACGKIACAASDPNLCTVSVRWNSSRSGGQENQTVETRSRL